MRALGQLGYAVAEVHAGGAALGDCEGVAHLVALVVPMGGDDAVRGADGGGDMAEARVGLGQEELDISCTGSHRYWV